MRFKDLKKRVIGLLTCASLKDDCLLPKQAMEDLDVRQQILDEVKRQLNELRAERIETERRVERARATLGGEDLWFTNDI